MKKLELLEGLRGYMAIWVFFTHGLTLGGFNFEKNKGIGKLLVNGDYAVTVFIILSGFVISILLEKQEHFTQYIKRRAFRLFPIYIVALIVSVLTLDFTKETLQAIPWVTSKNLGRLVLIDQGKEYFNISFISHLVLLHGLLPNQIIPTTYTLMGQAWSLTLEWQFYLLAPFLHKLIKLKFSPKTSIVYTFLIISAIVLSKMYMPQKSFLPNMLYCFAIGYFTCVFYRQYIKKENLFLFPFLLLILLLEINDTLLSAVPVAIWLIVIYFQSTGQKIGNFIFGNKLILSIGKVSYSFYCIHFFVLIFVSHFLIRIIHVENLIVYGISLNVIGLLITTLLSQLTYAFIELPFMNYARKNSQLK